MATDNRRVAAYFPKEVDEAFKKFKIENGFATEEKPSLNDSKALIHILSEFLKVEHSVAHSVSLPDNLVTTEQLESLSQEFQAKLSELLSNSLQLTQRIKVLESNQTLGKEQLESEPAEVRGQLSMLGETEGVDSQVSIGKTSVVSSQFEIPEEWLKGLSARKLEEFWPVNRRTIGNHKNNEDFAQWSADQDPHGIPWEYRQDTKKFYPAVSH